MFHKYLKSHKTVLMSYKNSKHDSKTENFLKYFLDMQEAIKFLKIHKIQFPNAFVFSKWVATPIITNSSLTKKKKTTLDKSRYTDDAYACISALFPHTGTPPTIISVLKKKKRKKKVESNTNPNTDAVVQF